jgi:hypothetical protein
MRVYEFKDEAHGRVAKVIDMVSGFWLLQLDGCTSARLECYCRFDEAMHLAEQFVFGAYYAAS